MLEHDLEPASPTTPQIDSQIEPTGTPEEYGLPKLPTEYERDRFARQERYLKAFIRQGNHIRSCQSTGIHRETSIYWEEHNVFQFRERLALAKERHRELLEQEHIYAPLNAASSRDKLLHPVLPIFALKGAWPEKYGDKVSVSDPSGLLNTLKALQALGAMNQGTRNGIAAPSTDAQVRELPPEPS